MKYKEAYELMKARSYKLGPEGVNFVSIRKANKVINQVSPRKYKAFHFVNVNLITNEDIDKI